MVAVSAALPLVRIAMAPFPAVLASGVMVPPPWVMEKLTVVPSETPPPPAAVSVALIEAGLEPSAGRLSGFALSSMLAICGPISVISVSPVIVGSVASTVMVSWPPPGTAPGAVYITVATPSVVTAVIVVPPLSNVPSTVVIVTVSWSTGLP